MKLSLSLFADYVYFENSSSNPYLIRRIEELNKVVAPGGLGPPSRTRRHMPPALGVLGAALNGHCLSRPSSSLVPGAPCLGLILPLSQGGSWGPRPGAVPTGS